MHFSGATLGEVSSPEREESGCGAGIFSLTSSGGAHSPAAPPPASVASSSPAATSSGKPSSSNFVRLLVGSKHHFDLVKINLGPCVQSSDSTRILTLASGSSTGAISATEVSTMYIPSGPPSLRPETPALPGGHKRGLGILSQSASKLRTKILKSFRIFVLRLLAFWVSP